MCGRGCYDKGFKLLTLVGLLILAQTAAAQGSTTLLRMQRSRASLNIDSNAQHGQGMNGITYGNPGDVWSYPNSASCLVVYNDGRYVLEKRDEQTVGRPKVKSAEGMLNAGDLQDLQALLDDEEIKKLRTPKVPDLPNDAKAVREMTTMNLEITRAGIPQTFATVQERVMTGGTSMSSGPANGLDTFLDNGAPYKKTLNPLIKWFEALEKKSKSSLKESKPQYCTPISVG
jgi:hypothetical protein